MKLPAVKNMMELIVADAGGAMRATPFDAARRRAGGMSARAGRHLSAGRRAASSVPARATE